MISISRLLHESKYPEKLCCLCLNAESEINKHFKLQDNAVLSLSNIVIISDMLQLTLGENIKNLLISESICNLCTKSLVSCFTFIKKTKENVEHHNKIIETLHNSFLPKKLEEKSKTMFIKLNQTEYTTNTYCCNNKCTSQRALTQFNSILMKNSDWKSKKHKNRRENQFKTQDIILDLNSKEFQCKVCLQKFLRREYLRAHFMRVHAPKIHKCDKCNRKYSSEFLLRQHSKENHASVICSECGKAFTHLPTLKRHELSHKLQIVCSDCGRVYKTQITFKMHKKLNVCGQLTRNSNSNASFACNICNKKYSKKSTLRVHIQFVHGTAKAHVCTWCNKKFSAESLLKAHIVTHTKEKNYQCETCSGKFVTKESLRYHMRIHTGDRPYKCGQCQCRFISASRRIEHVKKYHLDFATCKICIQESLPPTKTKPVPIHNT